MVNGEVIDNSKEKYPLLLFRDVTYFPLTWRFAVDEFGWNYTFDMEQGLQIASKLLFVEEDQYVIGDNLTVGFPDSVWNDQYKFTVYQDGEKVKAFSLQEDLMGGIYSFHAQLDENSFRYTPHTACIEGNILFLPCVRQDSNANKENVLLEIDLDKGKVVNKTKVD